MIKIYAVVGIMCSFIAGSVCASETLTLSTKELVRAKLWYEGIEAAPKDDMSEGESQVESARLNYPEELMVALDILEEEKK